MTANPLDAIAAAPPEFDESTMRSLLADEYGIRGDLTPLVSERDQNTRVDADTGERFVLKIANAAEVPVVTDFQVRALQHLESQGCEVELPLLVTTTAGDAVTHFDGASARHVVRLVTWVDGELLGDASLSLEIVERFGARLAQLGTALAGFAHPGDRLGSMWSMQRALQLRPLVELIDDPELRAAVGAVFDDFELRVLPHMSELRAQVIHNDANPGNVLVDETRADIKGFIDFGDMVHAPLVVDVAIAASYLRVLEGDALQFISPFVAGYHSSRLLAEAEIELLYDMIRTRLATSISFLHWRLTARGEEDAYRQATLASESSAEIFLSRLNEIGRKTFQESLVADF